MFSLPPVFLNLQTLSKLMLSFSASMEFLMMDVLLVNTVTQANVFVIASNIHVISLLAAPNLNQLLSLLLPKRIPKLRLISLSN